ncbi:MAG: hypothetical protein QM770_01510 [Tepidisphaeraceae bacterium]
MSAAIAHRGPDGEGLWFNRDPEDPTPITTDRPQVALAFRRLAILDPDPCAMQPMTTPDGRYTIVFNGEIYNYRELRAELDALAAEEKTSKLETRNSKLPWRTTGDTEVLLHAYTTWGPDCLHKLNGMFALAIWDEQEKSLFLRAIGWGRSRCMRRCAMGDSTSPANALLRASYRSVNTRGRAAGLPNSYSSAVLVQDRAR